MATGQLARPNAVPDSGADTAAREQPADGQLLEEFVQRQDEAAFATLVERHGAMVLGVCRRVLRHDQDAEDAFQATFLVLVRKARSLARPELLANWLYGVAYRTAQQARARTLRQGRQEKEAASMSAAASDPDSFWREVQPLLDAELNQLPERYRAALVLCYLEGKTNEEAARELDWPVGSMSFRLARGREMLRDRVTSRLRAAPAVLPLGFLTSPLEASVVPAPLADATVQAALGLVGAKAAVGAFISGSVLDLMNATLRVLAPRRQPWLFGMVLTGLSVLGLGAVAFAIAAQPASDRQPSFAPSPALVSVPPTALPPGVAITSGHCSKAPETDDRHSSAGTTSAVSAKPASQSPVP
jgi:polysaccharide biosynthesis/export protein